MCDQKNVNGKLKKLIKILIKNDNDFNKHIQSEIENVFKFDENDENKNEQALTLFSKSNFIIKLHDLDYKELIPYLNTESLVINLTKYIL